MQGMFAVRAGFEKVCMGRFRLNHLLRPDQLEISYESPNPVRNCVGKS